jgi:hypothetical protein
MTAVTVTTKESDLAPTLPVPDLALVLEMCDHLGFAWQSPHEAPPVWCGVLLRRLHVYLCLVDEGRRLIYSGYQQLHESVHHVVVVILIADLESVVEENVGCRDNNNSGKAFFANFLYPVPLTFIIAGTDLLLLS